MLRYYHRRLWSKALPDGTQSDLKTVSFEKSLRHTSTAGDLSLASNEAVPTYGMWNPIRHVVDQIGEDAMGELRRVAGTIDGFALFPGNVVGGKIPVNGTRSCHKRIDGRMDLIVECIRVTTSVSPARSQMCWAGMATSSSSSTETSSTSSWKTS